MTSMFVPEPVMSLAISPKKSKKGGGSDITDKFSKVKTNDNFGISSFAQIYGKYSCHGFLKSELISDRSVCSDFSGIWSSKI